ncbi:MAG: ABC transporter permease [Dehalococcoidia bacterium]|nr:ABC transporter permease [Dehalococcoidia bacterium]
MRNTLVLTGKELRSYFVSPVAYVVMAAFLVINGYFFATMIFFSQESSLRYLFSDMSIVLLLLTPIMTMRLLSEEKKTGTIELLLTSPMRDGEVVIGKFLASFVFLGVMLALTGYYSLLIVAFGKPDWGPILSGYLGVVLLGASFLSIGLLTSSLTQNQIVAAVLSFAVLMVLWLITWVGDFAGPQFKDIIAYIGLMDHFDDFTKGVINLKDVVFYCSVVAISLLVTVRVLESRRWK